MFLPTTRRLPAALVALTAAVAIPTSAFAQSSEAPPSAESADRADKWSPPHGGQAASTAAHHFEVVYRPRETRIYLYGPGHRRVTARGVEGQVVMQVRGNPEQFRYPVLYVPAGGGEQPGDYLSVPVDVSRIRDGDMRVTFDLAGLPYRQEPRARFTQTFALSRTSLTVRVAPLTAADRPAIARQQVCPVMEQPLGSHGEVIKVLVGDTPLYLCCRGCIRKVQDNPQAYLRKAAGPAAAEKSSSAAAEVTLRKATAADRAAIRAQGTCPVMKQPLGAHGTPWKVSQGDRSLFICCRGCVSRIKQNPDRYFAQARQLRRDP